MGDRDITHKLKHCIQEVDMFINGFVKAVKALHNHKCMSVGSVHLWIGCEPSLPIS